MASIPPGSLILDVEQALQYFPQWTPRDRKLAREWIDETEVTDFYVPPSGGYVACHGGPNLSAYSGVPVNGLVMHVGFLEVRPTHGGGERVELSSSRGPGTRSASTRQSESASGQTCPQCRMVSPRHLDECDQCGNALSAPVDNLLARILAEIQERHDPD